jgi:hypothetical protein
VCRVLLTLVCLGTSIFTCRNGEGGDLVGKPNSNLVTPISDGKAQGYGLYGNKGLCKAWPTMGLILVKSIASGFIKCKELLQ